MKIDNMTNQVIVQNFLRIIMDIVAENTSNKYGLLVVDEIKNKLRNKFKFSQNITISNNSIKVDKKLNYVDKKELKSFFSEIINLAGADYVRNLLAKRLSQNQINYLQYIGLKLY